MDGGRRMSPAWTMTLWTIWKQIEKRTQFIIFWKWYGRWSKREQVWLPRSSQNFIEAATPILGKVDWLGNVCDLPRLYYLLTLIKFT